MNTLPEYVVVVSLGKTALENGPTASLPDAVAWCARGMLRFGALADQVAIARPSMVYHLHLGDQMVLVPVQGWKRNDDGWHAVLPSALDLEINEVRGSATETTAPDEPTTLASSDGLKHLTSAIVDLTVAVRHLASPSRARELLMTRPGRSLPLDLADCGLRVSFGSFTRIADHKTSRDRRAASSTLSGVQAVAPLWAKATRKDAAAE